MEDSEIRAGRPREWIQARLPDGRIFEARPGTALSRLLQVAEGDQPCGTMAAVVNGRLRELTSSLDTDSEVAPVTLCDLDGVRIYRRSLGFLMLTAVEELFPDAEVFIEHSATTSAAYYCEVRGRENFSPEELRAIEQRMREIVSQDDPIRRAEVALDEAIRVVRARGEEDKAQLFTHRQRPTAVLYTLRGRQDCLQGYAVPSAGCLKYFALRSFPPGFMLHFPHQHQPTELSPITPYPRLFEVFEESGHWLDRLGIRCTGALNDSIMSGRLPEVSLVAEALHEARISRIATIIAALRDQVRIVLIAGPSSSGKTTFSKRLSIQLLANGLRPFPLSLDDYFVERSRTPRDANNEYDYESLRALDVGLFNEHLKQLIEGREVQLPRYVFTTGTSEAGPRVTLGTDNIIIVEGIHGLNPALVPGLPPKQVYRVYVSALTQLNLDRHNRLSTTDCRLIRRIVRDAATRGYDATGTLKRWGAVVAGEKQNIFPFQENAHAIFNSALVHELSVLRPFADPLLLQVRPEEPEYLEANRLLTLLQWFRPVATDHVPSNSILREFVGGSILGDFRLWPTPPVPGS